MRAWTLLGVVGLVALAGVALGALGLGPAGAQGPGGPEGVELRLSLVDDADGVVRAGSTIRVGAELRLEPWDEALTLSAGDVWLHGSSQARGGSNVWETNGRPRLPLEEQFLLSPLAESGERIAYDSNNPPSSPLGNGQQLRIIAYDGKTLVARARNHWLYIFNTETGDQIGRLRASPQSGNRCAYRYDSTSTCTPDGGHHGYGWGRQSDEGLGGAVDIWQENENTAWLFIGAHRDRVTDGTYVWQRVGGLYIFEVNYAPATPTINQRNRIPNITWPRRVLAPTLNEFRSQRANGGIGQDNMAWFGTSVAISADGSTLAVGAPFIHDVGAVYVYSKPAGGWGASLGWNDAVRVEPVAIPAWGDAANERPFNPQSTGRTSANSDCDAYCSRASSYTGDHFTSGTSNPRYQDLNLRAQFGAHVDLSGDGSVLAVSAPTKRWASTTPGGSGVFRNTSLAAHGEVLIFRAPAGGWSAVPNYKTGRSHLAWNASAASFDPSTHYNTGPNQRVVEPTWTFSFPWSEQRDYYLGQKLALSDDGTVLAANDRINDAVNIFQVASPSGWANGPTAPTAQLTGAVDGGRGGEIGFSPNGLLLAVGDPTWSSNQGRVLIFSRPAGGDWADAGADEARVALAPTAPTDRRVTNEWYGRTLDWGGAKAGTPFGLLAVGAAEGDNRDGFQSNTDVGPGRFWTRDELLECPISERTDDAGTTRTAICRLDLGDTRVVIPRGTPDGMFTIAGTVTATYGEGLTLERTARLEVEVGTVREVAEVKVELGVDDRGTPTDVRDDRPQRSVLNARGESTELRLQILNEREAAAATGSVASVVATTTAGSLSTTFGGGCTNGGGNACELNVSALTSLNADKIPLTLTHGGTGGTASVVVLAVAKADGETEESAPLAVVLAGAATSLSIAEASDAVLNVDTSDDVETLDNRDVLELIVTARDALGHTVPAPTAGASYRITGPDGRSVGSGKIAAQWPLSAAHCWTGGTHPVFPAFPLGHFGAHSPALSTTAAQLSADNSNVPLCVAQGNRLRAYDAQSEDFAIAPNTRVLVLRSSGATREFELGDLRSKARLNVEAAADEPLAAGEYTLELRAGGLTARQTFRVSGGAASVTVAAPEGRLAVGEQVSVTATVSDADGNAVTDGTPVDWTASDSSGGATVLVQISANPTTMGGSSTSVWQVVGPGVSAVRASAGGAAAEVRLVRVPEPMAPVSPVEYLSSRAPGFLSGWNGEGTTRASALLADLESIGGLLLWTPEGWLRYAVTSEGGLVPGSVDFEVVRGSVLWLSW